ncbi:hypothetical protein [Methanobrevibacter sp.]|uniref:hypothetical protein n=1 Tax=Methanobrevibacter sp. TaxID=66852 RepID=UPI00389081F9
MAIERALVLRDVSRDGQFKAESISRTVDDYYTQTNEMREWFYSKVRDNVRMMTYVLSNQIVDGEFTGSRNYDDGIVVRIQNGKFEDPKSLVDYFPDVTAEQILKEYEPFNSNNAAGEMMLLTSGHIGDGW